MDMKKNKSYESELLEKHDKIIKTENKEKIIESFNETETKLFQARYIFAEKLKQELKIMEMQNINSYTFFGWVGGKSNLALEIIDKIPQHEIYVELFLGSGILFMKKQKAPINILNDINLHLTTLFRCCQHDVDSLITECYWLHKNRQVFKLFKNSLKNYLKDPVGWNPYRLAAMYLYVIRNSFNNQELNAVFRTRKLEEQVDWTEDIFSLLKFINNKLRNNVEITNLSFDKLIDRYKLIETNKSLFIYADPPYWVANETKYYKYNFIKEQHILLAEMLKELNKNKNINFIISYDNVPEIKELYKDFTINESSVCCYTMNNDNRKRESELLISNFQLREQLKMEI